MKRTLFMILIAGGSLLLLQQAFAQKANKKLSWGSSTTTKPPLKVTEVDVTLGRSALKGGPVSKKTFDSLLKQGIMGTDGAKVTGFTFSYSEMNYYEDSLGNPIRVMDYMEEFCAGNTLSPIIGETIFQRTKPGDTAYIEHIKVMLPSGLEAKGRSMKFPIVSGKR